MGIHKSMDDWLDLLKGVPKKTRLDIVQMALDLVGIVEPTGVADATSGFISLMRGDFFGAAISGLSILPLGDLAKGGKLARYVDSMRDLVSIALRNPKIAFGMRRMMRQLRDLLLQLNGVMGTGGEAVKSADVHVLGKLQEQVARYLEKITLIERMGPKKVAIRNGRVSKAGQFTDASVRGSKVTVKSVVETLESAVKSGGRGKLKKGAEEMIEKMALADRWEITAGLHRSASDANRHITIKLDTFKEQFHLVTDKRGHLYRITYGKKALDLTK